MWSSRDTHTVTSEKGILTFSNRVCSLSLHQTLRMSHLPLLLPFAKCFCLQWAVTATSSFPLSTSRGRSNPCCPSSGPPCSPGISHSSQSIDLLTQSHSAEKNTSQDTISLPGGREPHKHNPWNPHTPPSSATSGANGLGQWEASAGRSVLVVATFLFLSLPLQNQT